MLDKQMSHDGIWGDPLQFRRFLACAALENGVLPIAKKAGYKCGNTIEFPMKNTFSTRVARSNFKFKQQCENNANYCPRIPNLCNCGDSQELYLFPAAAAFAEETRRHICGFPPMGGRNGAGIEPSECPTEGKGLHLELDHGRPVVPTTLGHLQYFPVVALRNQQGRKT
jgi:hypothetical protein